MFWEKYTALCAQQGASPNSVAKSLSIASGTVTKWKNGSVPQNATLKKIADYFGVTVESLTEASVNVTVDVQGTAQAMKIPEALDPRLLALIDSMTEEEVDDLLRYAEFILSRKKD
jgi:transcriptional regulator with XRE-family HTH domain